MSEPNPFATTCHELDAPYSATEAAFTPSTPSSTYLLGVEAAMRPVGYGENSWLSTLIVAMVVLLALNINNCRRILKNFPQDLLGVRRRANVFDEHTAGEARVSILIVMLLCLSEGILLLSAVYSQGYETDEKAIFATTMLLSGAALIFFIGQLAAYRLIGYAFTDRVSATQWIRGFVASQGLLSFLLLGPALISLFYPSSADAMLTVSLIAYIASRILFICKGFKIFYNKIPSLLYFILYLCSVEIVPLIMMRAGSIDLLNLL